MTATVHERIAVSGASGFIGRHLCNHLLGLGHEVVALTRRAETSSNARKINIPLDLLQMDVSSGALDGCKAVIHLAGRAHVLNEKAEDPLSEFRKANVQATLNLLHLAMQAGVKRFVFVSSIGVNGSFTKGRPFTETDEEAPQDLYAISKFEAEQEIREYAKKTGIEFVIVRPPLVFGPDAPGNFALLLKLAAAGIPLPFGRFSSRRNLVSVWNLVDLLYQCATHPEAAGQIFLAADKEDVTLADIFRNLRFGMNKSPRLFDFPTAWMSKGASITGKIRMFEKLNAELRVDSTKATTVLGWQPPYTTYDALKRTGQEYLRNRNDEKNARP